MSGEETEDYCDDCEYHDDPDYCPECGGCLECGTCYCDDDYEFEPPDAS